MSLPRWLERLLHWVLWLVRPKYLVGVFPICIDDDERVLLIRKRLGASLGWQLPGGGKAYGVSFERTACNELEEETGLHTDPERLRFVCTQCVEENWDINIAYLVVACSGEVAVRDTLEIHEARWVPIVQARTLLLPSHRPMLESALKAFYRWGYGFR